MGISLLPGPIMAFLRNIHSHRAMITALARRDLQSRYAGTLGGTLWTFLHPMAVVAVFYVVFAIGFKSVGPQGTPFILWFVGGLVPWFFFNDTLLAATNSVTANAHLVKKTVFPTEVLPLIHVGSGLVPHFVFLGILAVIMVLYRVPFHLERLLFVYYTFCTVTLILGLGWLLSALQVFYRDIAQALTVLLNLLFWATPIVWTASLLPEAYQPYLELNPIYYVVEGYRGLMIYPEVQWPSLEQTLYFWGFSLVSVGLGTYVFSRLKPEFADVI